MPMPVILSDTVYVVPRNSNVALGALAEFKAISTSWPYNPEAANNKAVCLLYSGTLTDAVQVSIHTSFFCI